MALQLNRRRFTVAEYYQMVEAGILREDDRVELIEGEILEMSPIGNLHFVTVNRISRHFFLRLSDVAIVSIQNPVILNDRNAPQPDIVVARLREDEYGSALPGPEDVILLIEVSDSTLRFDRTVKLPIYARTGVPEVWIVDVKRGTITAYREPGPAGYQDVVIASRGGSLAPLLLPDRGFAVDDLLAPG